MADDGEGRAGGPEGTGTGKAGSWSWVERLKPNSREKKILTSAVAFVGILSAVGPLVAPFAQGPAATLLYSAALIIVVLMLVIFVNRVLRRKVVLPIPVVFIVFAGAALAGGLAGHELKSGPSSHPETPSLSGSPATNPLTSSTHSSVPPTSYTAEPKVAANCSPPHRARPRNLSLAAGVTVTYYDLPHGSAPVEIADGKDGTLWFTEYGSGKIGRLSANGLLMECRVPSAGAYPFAITAGPDGNMWFTEGNPDNPGTGYNSVGMITATGRISQYMIPTPGTAAVGITSGSDGNLWFTEYNAGRIGRVTVHGKITEFILPQGGQPDQITTGPGGDLWFTEFAGNKIGRITPQGNILEYSTRSNGNPVGILNVRRELWFANVTGDDIEQMSPGGRVVGSIPVPTREVPGVANLTMDSRNNIWFTEVKAGLVGYIPGTNHFNVSAEYRVADNGGLIDIVIGPDGDPWFTVQDSDMIGRLVRS